MTWEKKILSIVAFGAKFPQKLRNESESHGLQNKTEEEEEKRIQGEFAFLVFAIQMKVEMLKKIRYRSQDDVRLCA